MTDQARISAFSHDGYSFDVLDDGPMGGDVIVCLHGFPQSNRSWGKVTPLLHDAGFRTLCPNQRGYSPGALARRRRDYATDVLAGDIIGLLDAAGATRAHIVGHDWGGAVAWQLAGTHPDRVASVAVISTPHPGAMQQAFLHSRQALNSWYMLAFQIPWVPETLLARAGKKRIVDGLTGDGLSEESAADSAALLADPKVGRAMINWYRGLPFSARTPLGHIDVPALYIWSDGDHYLGRYGAEHTADFVNGPYRFLEIHGGTHWLPDTHPKRVADAIVAQASEHPADPR